MPQVSSSIRVDYVGQSGVRYSVQKPNVAFRGELWDAAVLAWTGSGLLTPIPWLWPWKHHPAFAANASHTNIRRSTHSEGNNNGYSGWILPSGMGNLRERWDYGRMRWFNTTAGASLQTDQPFVAGSVCVAHGYRGYQVGVSGQGNVFSSIDLGITQIGAPYLHPVYSTSISTTAGQSYVTATAPGFVYAFPHLISVFRLESGADRGIYIVQGIDRANNRIYLRNFDGSKWTAQATASVSNSQGYRTAYFNETGVIPNSTGQVAFDGLYDAGESRGSYIFRVHFEKSGSPSPASEAQRGSYWLSARGYLYGKGAYGDQWTEDNGGPFVQRYLMAHPNTGYGFLYGTSILSMTAAQCTGMALERTNQRLWLSVTDSSTGNSSLGYWNYKSPESFREVASWGTPNDPLPVPFILAAAASVRPPAIGSDNTVYFPISKPSDQSVSGWLAIKPDLSRSFMQASVVGVPANTASVGFCAIDTTRARTGASGTAGTTSDGRVTATDGAFSASDTGRCIKITGSSADNGTYLISSVTDSANVVVTQLNGSAVSLTGGSGGTFQIGDRIYLFVASEATWNAGKMSWTDSLSFGTRFTKTVTMTAGAQLYFYGYPCAGPSCCVDPVTGRLFWSSVDGVKHLNMYDPATQTVTQRPLSDFAIQVPGSNANPTAPTDLITVAANTNSYFRELWVGTNTGHYRFNPDNFTAQFARFYGMSTGTYAEADGLLQLDGSSSENFGGAQNTGATSYGFMPDGQVYAMQPASAVSGSYNTAYLVKFSRENHNWLAAQPPTYQETGYGSLNGVRPLWYANTDAFFLDPYGGIVFCWPLMKAEQAKGVIRIGHPSAIHYQWIGGAWVAKEVVRSGLPDSVSSPGCLCKPLHSTLDDLIMGVKVKFTSSGASGGEDNEFLGRFAQRGIGRTDGATTSGSAGFVGSGFASLSFTTSDVGRYYLRIESGADQGTYKILSYTSDTQISLQKFSGVAFSATASAGSLAYSVWDTQTGAVGPECCSVLVNVGIGKDNTQDLTGIYLDYYGAKTALSEQAESPKFCSDILPVMGASAIQLYSESYSLDYRVAMGAHLALPGSPVANLIPLDGSVSRINTLLMSPASWRGTQVGVAAGFAVSVDLGVDVEIGSVLVRGVSTTTGGGTLPAVMFPTNAGQGGGMIANILTALSSGGTPTNSSTVRCAGTTNLSGTANTATVTTSGDFLGSATGVVASDGQTNSISIGASSFQSAAGRFSSANVGMILKVTSGADVGNYRILTVSGDGSTVSVRNLDQSIKVWGGAGTGLAFTVYDGVQEEDLICIPSVASPTYRLVIERLSNDAKTAYPRIQLGTTIANQSWQCAKPTWNLVKRLSASGTVVAPEVASNGTFVSADGLENFGQTNFLGSAGYYPYRTWKAVMDFSDLSSAKRTGRWWKWAAQGRETTAGSYDGQHYITSIEFYDTAGKRLFLHSYCLADTVFTQPQMMAVCFTRADFLIASNAAASQYAGYNGTAALGGTYGNTITLTGGNKFLGYQLRPRGNLGSIPGGSNVFNGHANDSPFITIGDVGKFLKINSGVNAGVYRIATVPLSTQVTLVSVNSAAVSLTADAGPVEYSVHEGINVGGSSPDFIVFTTGGNTSGLVEMSLATLSGDLTTLTIGEKQFNSLSGQSWEIRRRALEDRSQSGTNSAVSARLLFSEYLSPAQPGDISQDTKGYVKFWPGDIGGANKTAGVAVAGTATFQSASSGMFTPDDVGRIILITSGSNKGPYRITSYNNSGEVVLVNHYTGVAASFVGDASVSYTILGERRFRLSRYVTSLRS